MRSAGEAYHVLAGQEGIWELHYRPGHGLEWHIGDVVLSDVTFEPSRCNSIVLTGYFQPHGPLTKREARSPLKLYSSGFLRDIYHDFSFGQIDDVLPGNPTFVNFNGSARSSNMMLSSYSDSYEPRLEPEHHAAFTALFQ